MSKQKSQPYRLSKLLKSVHKDNLHPEIFGNGDAVSVALDRYQIAGLKKLGKKHGTNVATELSNAVDAYLLGLSRDEIRFLGIFGDMIKSSASKINQKLTETLLEIDKSAARIARMERRAVNSRRKKQR